MMMWIAVILIYAMCLASATYLVITEHYGWAWIPFVILAFSEFSSKPSKPKKDGTA